MVVQLRREVYLILIDHSASLANRSLLTYVNCDNYHVFTNLKIYYCRYPKTGENEGAGSDKFPNTIKQMSVSLVARNEGKEEKTTKWNNLNCTCL